MPRPGEFDHGRWDYMLDLPELWPVRTDRAEIEEVTCETCPNRTVARDGFCSTCRRFIREEDQASRDLTG